VQQVVTASDAHDARRLVAQRRQFIQLCLDLIETMANGLEQALSRRRRRNAARRTRKQADLKASLQAADGLAECRLRDTQQRGGTSEAAFPRDGDEG